jgi:hypothetical protein
MATFMELVIPRQMALEGQLKDQCFQGTPGHTGSHGQDCNWRMASCYFMGHTKQDMVASLLLLLWLNHVVILVIGDGFCFTEPDGDGECMDDMMAR